MLALLIEEGFCFKNEVSLLKEIEIFSVPFRRLPQCKELYDL
jgi:hypothetical protein